MAERKRWRRSIIRGAFSRRKLISAVCRDPLYRLCHPVCNSMCKACVQAYFSLFPFMLLFPLHLMFLEWWTAQVGWEWEVVSFFLAPQRDGIAVGSISRIPLLQPFLGTLAHKNLIFYKSPNQWKQNSRAFCSAPFLNPCLLPNTKFPHGRITKRLLKQIWWGGGCLHPILPLWSLHLGSTEVRK